MNMFAKYDENPAMTLQDIKETKRYKRTDARICLAYMNMCARFDENPPMTLQDIKETKRYGRTDARTDGQRENSIPTTNKVCGGYNYF